MRQRYFTPETITAAARELRSRVAALVRTQAHPILPEQSALLVLDLQRYFFNPESHAFIPSAPAILPGIQALLATYRASKLPVYFTRHLNKPGDARRMADWWRELIAADNPMSELLLELEQDEPVIIKSQYDAFYQTGLEQRFRQIGIRQVLVCGVMANLCCETTARSAFMRGFEVFFLVDGVAAYNQELHFASLLNLSHGFATPVLVDEALAAVKTREKHARD